MKRFKLISLVGVLLLASLGYSADIAVISQITCNEKLLEFDFMISSFYVNDFLSLNDQSLLVEGSGIHEVQANGNSYVEIQNTTPYKWKTGGVGRVLLFDQSDINIYDGEISNVTTMGVSNMNIYGGEIGSLIVMENSSAILYGGNINSIRNSQSVSVGTEIDLEVVCKSWIWNESTNHITGIWGNDLSFNIRLVDTSWNNSETYRMIDHISFTIVPEPASLLIFAISVLFLRRR